MKAERLSLLLLFLLSFNFSAFAASGITYQGRLLDPSGTPVTSSNVQFKMQIRTPGTQDCLLYEEVKTEDLSATSGVFALSIGDGTGTRTDAHSSDWSLFEALSNRKTFSFSSGECTGATTYTPNPDDNRKFRVFFDDGSGSGWQSMPTQVINYIPMSIETYAVGGFPASSLLRVEDSGTLGNVSALTSTQYNNLESLANGTSSAYEKSGELNGSALPSLTSGQSFVSDGSGGWVASTPLTSESDPNVSAFAKTSLPTCGVGEVLKSDGTQLTCVTDSGGWTAADATATTKGIVSVPASGGLEVTTGALGLPDQTLTPGSFTKVTVNQKGIVTSGTTLSESDLPTLTTAGKVSGSAITSGTIAGSTAINTSGDITTTGDLSVTGSATTGSFSTRQFDLYDSDNTNKISFLTPATGSLTTDYNLVFPATLGSSNQILGMNNAGTALENKSLTAGTGVTITHSAGGIEISATGSGGTVTSVTGTSPISVDNTDAANPIVTLSNSGVGAGTYGSATEVPVFTVDAKGRVTSVTDTTISAVSPVGATLTSGQVWMGDGTNKAVAGNFGISNLKTSLGSQQWPSTSCTSGQTLTWSSITDALSCTNISITTSQVSNFPTLGTASAEDVGTSAGNVVQLDGSGKIPSSLLPNGVSTQWTTTGSDIYYSTGNVGIGTNAPSYLLDLRNSNNASQIHISGTGGDDGGYITAYGSDNFYINMSSAYNGTNWIAKGSAASILAQEDGSFAFYSDTGLTAGSSYAPTERARLTEDGIMRVRKRVTVGGENLTSGDLGTMTAYSMAGGIDRGISSVQISSDINAGAFIGRKARGTYSASTAVQNGDYVSMLAASPFDGTDYLAPAMAAFMVNGTVATGSVPMDFVVNTGATGSSGGAERMRITSAGKVGIGTINPSTELEVVGTIKATGFEGPLTSTSTSIGDGSATSPSMTFTNDPNTGFYSSGADTIGISAGGNKVWDITTSSIVSPTTGGALVSSSNGTASNPTFSFAGDPDTGWFRPLANTLAASTGGSERVRIDSSGNVGIGTDSPFYKLHIFGGNDVTVSGGGYLAIGDVNSTNMMFDDDEIMARNNGSAVVLHLQNEGGGLQVGPDDQGLVVVGDGSTDVKADLGATSGFHTLFRSYRPVGGSGGIGLGYLADGTNDSAAFVRTTGSSMDLAFAPVDGAGDPVERMRLTSTGSVGIGTDSPGSALEINSNNSTTQLRLRYDSSYYTDFVSDHINAVGASQNFDIQINGTPRLSVRDSGNVGIGTTAPAYMLDVNGVAQALRFYSSADITSGSGYNISMNRSDNTKQELIGFMQASVQKYTVGMNATSDNFSFNSFSGDFNFSGGNVGIDTIAPAYPLDIRGSAHDGVHITNTGGDEGLYLAGSSSGSNIQSNVGYDGTNFIAKATSASLINQTGGSINFQADSGLTVGSAYTPTFRMSIRPNGNVGIGVPNPTYQLQLSTDSAAKPGTSTWTIASDRRLKDINGSFERGLDALEGIHPIYFNYKVDNPLKLPSDKEYVGVIAQDVEKAVPEAITKDEKGYLHVTNDSIIWTMLNSIKELYHQWMDDSEQIHRELASKDQKIKKLEEENTAIKAYLCAKDAQAPFCQR